MNPTIEELNALTEAGIISDNAVTWNDVAPIDQAKALEFLEAIRPKTQPALFDSEPSYPSRR